MAVFGYDKPPPATEVNKDAARKGLNKICQEEGLRDNLVELIASAMGDKKRTSNLNSAIDKLPNYKEIMEALRPPDERARGMTALRAVGANEGPAQMNDAAGGRRRTKNAKYYNKRRRTKRRRSNKRRA